MSVNRFYAEQVAEFKKLVQTTIDVGAGDEETALRWLIGEKFYHIQDVESWVWDCNILFTDYGKELVKKLDKIVTYEEWLDCKMNEVVRDIEILENLVIAMNEGASDEKYAHLYAVEKLLIEKKDLVRKFEEEFCDDTSKVAA